MDAFDNWSQNATQFMNKTDFWKRKLAAYLHDPPSKALDNKNRGITAVLRLFSTC
jgi:hypothetical protein